MKGYFLHITELAESQRIEIYAQHQARLVLCVFRVKVLERLHRLRQILLAKI